MKTAILTLAAFAIGISLPQFLHPTITTILQIIVIGCLLVAMVVDLIRK